MKTVRKILAYLLTLVMLVCTVNISDVMQVQAQSITKATPYTIGTSQSGVITENGDAKQYYTFTLPSSGEVHLTGSAYMERMYWRIYDQNAEEVWQIQSYWNSTSEVITLDETLYLTSGTYYLCAEQSWGYGNYNFRLDFISSNESFSEANWGSNNTLNTASMIDTSGKEYNGQLALNDEKDFYKFTLTDSGKVTLNVTFFKMKYVYWKLYDENGEELLSRQPWWNSTTEDIVVDEDLYLTSGNYYISYVCGSGYGKYTFSAKFSSANETYSEKNCGSNNTIQDASSLTIGKKVTGQIAINDEKDFYKFSFSSRQSYTVALNAEIRGVYVRLYDSNGNEIWSECPWSNETTQKISWSKITYLEPGTYYVSISQYGDNYGTYNLSVSRLTQSNCPHEKYDTTWHNATYFSKGYRLHKCQDCGYSYKDNYTPVLKLSQGATQSYYCTAGKGVMKIYWYTNSNASGYQVRYCKSSRFNSGVITKTVKGNSRNYITVSKLKRRQTYYVQVRPYKKSGSKTVYGAWSSKLKLRTK